MATNLQSKLLTTSELIEHLKVFKFTRVLKQFHIHHTWLPNYASFNGTNHLALQEGMRNYHVNTNKWSDIAQHLTLFPDGRWLLGRNLDIDPASIYGWNSGALCVEMVGDFDKGKDTMRIEQKEAIYELTEYMVLIRKLEPKFHRDHPNAGKTCPGSGIDRELFFKEALSFSVRKVAEETERLEKVVGDMKIVFKDMLVKGKEHWANKFINFLYDKGILSGYKQSDGSMLFKPDNNITRAETATLIARSLEEVEKELNKIKDALKKANISI